MLEYNERGFVNGYLERKVGGRYEGQIKIDGVNLASIEGVYFKENGSTHLWLKRKPILEYDSHTGTYKQKIREPRWEAYLHKENIDGVAYRGEFVFMRFKYSIVGVWDAVFGQSKQRLNFFVERLPNDKQTIINLINQRNRELYNKK